MPLVVRHHCPNFLQSKRNQSSLRFRNSWRKLGRNVRNVLEFTESIREEKERICQPRASTTATTRSRERRKEAIKFQDPHILWFRQEFFFPLTVSVSLWNVCGCISAAKASPFQLYGIILIPSWSTTLHNVVCINGIYVVVWHGVWLVVFVFFWFVCFRRVVGRRCWVIFVQYISWVWMCIPGSFDSPLSIIYLFVLFG